LYVAVIIGGESATAVGLAKSLVAGKVEVHLFACGHLTPLASGVSGVKTHRLDKLDRSLVDRLHALTKRSQLALFPATDEAVVWLDINRGAFGLDWLVPKLNGRSMHMALNKVEMQRYASAAGFSVPKTLVIDPVASEVDGIDASWFPVIVKPLDSLERGKESMAVLADQSSLNSYVRNLVTRPPLMVQEYVSGDASGGIYEVFAAFNPLVMKRPTCVVAKKARIFPDLIGSSSAIYTVNDVTLQDLVRRYIELSGFVGVLDLECVKRAGAYYFIEVNYRCGTPIDLARVAGINIPLLWIGAEDPIDADPLIEVPERFYVREPSEIANAKSGGVSWATVLRCFFAADTRLIIDGRHPMVAINFIWQKLKRRLDSLSLSRGGHNGS
jgi:predicted ATP-grasp superfamily ATP-dependent carboligase